MVHWWLVIILMNLDGGGDIEVFPHPFFSQQECVAAADTLTVRRRARTYNEQQAFCLKRTP